MRIVLDAPPPTAAHIEFLCATCPHTWESHDPTAVRYCSATVARGLDRGCACTRPAAHAETYYR
ncbi:RGCVC family protein [Nocardia acidivorans]|uniref:RGCVC family protein n=1 Tax=Nocardia acidivorans TaxID=404580 RepID=UPI000A050973